jgi:protein-disulfide isomerase
VSDHNVGVYGDAALLAIAGDVGLDTNQFETCTRDGATLDRVRAERNRGESLGVTGTPTVLVNGEEFDGSLEELTAIVTAAANGS